MVYFKYTKSETDFLKNKDPILGKEIDRIGIVKRRIEPDPFKGLISSIISQQISTKAALTVKKRLNELAVEITPGNLNKIESEVIQKCGMTVRKAGYIKNIAKAAYTNAIDFKNLHKLSDEEIMEKLTALKGVGEWTVEMLLIHSLQRPDILSYKDLGIQRGLKRLYGLNELSKKEFDLYKDKFSPYGTVASIYIWEIASEKQ